MLLLCQWRPDVHVEWVGRWMVVLSSVVGVEGVGEGEVVVGMW